MNAERIQQRSTQGRRGKVHDGIHNCLSFYTFIICTWTCYDALYIPCNKYLWANKNATRNTGYKKISNLKYDLLLSLSQVPGLGKGSPLKGSSTSPVRLKKKRRTSS